MDGGGWTLSIFVSLLVVVLVVLAIVWLIRTQNAGASIRQRRDEGDSARELLERHMVSGEIGENEYQRLGRATSEALTPSEPQTIRRIRSRRPGTMPSGLRSDA